MTETIFEKNLPSVSHPLTLIFDLYCSQPPGGQATLASLLGSCPIIPHYIKSICLKRFYLLLLNYIEVAVQPNISDTHEWLRLNTRLFPGMQHTTLQVLCVRVSEHLCLCGSTRCSVPREHACCVFYIHEADHMGMLTVWKYCLHSGEMKRRESPITQACASWLSTAGYWLYSTKMHHEYSMKHLWAASHTAHSFFIFGTQHDHNIE